MMRIKANKELWSDKLKGSYDPEPCYYIDEEYECHYCKKKVVWSAKEQKHDYEVLKRGWGGRTFCKPCHKEYLLIKEKLAKYRRMWASEKKENRKFVPYLKDYLISIKEYKKYTNKGHDTGMETHLESLLSE